MVTLFRASGSSVPSELHPFSKAFLGPEWLSEFHHDQILGRKQEKEGKRKKAQAVCLPPLEVPSLEYSQLFLLIFFEKKFHHMATAHSKGVWEK